MLSPPPVPAWEIVNAVERRLRNIDQIKFQIGQGGFQVIADIGADGAGADHHHAARQWARRFS